MALLARFTGSVLFLSNNYYFRLILNFPKVKLYKKHFSKILLLNKHSHTYSYLHSDLANKRKSETNYVSYDEVLTQRRLEAKKSVIIEVHSDKSCNDVYTYCSQFGKITQMFHYTTKKTERHFVLIEFANQKIVKEVLSSATHTNHEQIIPVQSSLLWFRNCHNREKKILTTNFNEMSFSKFSCRILSNYDVMKLLITEKSISDQIMLLYNATKLNDVGIRLRFITAYQIERSFQGLFPNMAVLPFGSSVNGFGKEGCDLDLSGMFEENNEENISSRLVFQTKSALIHERFQIKKLIESIGDMMHIYIPGISNVRKISEARVPIIKFDHMLTGIECDLAMKNMSAYYMSELMYIFGEIDWRVRPLIFTIRRWAQSLKLTSNNPGPWITNFSLSLMVLFFLQQKKILPDFNLLKSCATQKDFRIADVYVDCTFLRDINKLPKVNKIPNVDTLESLLSDFFTYFGNFDFDKNAISLREGRPVSKPDYSALYICNPLETSLNVSKNVKFEELERIKIAIRNASWHMESKDHETQNSGLISLFMPEKAENIGNLKSFNKKSIDFEALFDSKSMYSTKEKIDKKKQRVDKTKIL